MTLSSTSSARRVRPAQPSWLGPASTPSQTAITPLAFGGSPVQKIPQTIARIGQGNGATHAVMQFFNRVNTSFFYQLFLLDFVALFLTRVSSALVIGREKYDALSDRMRHYRTQGQQAWHQVNETWRGLNWQNGKETLIREGLTAPGCLLLPSLAFLGTQKLLQGKAQEIRQRDFNALFDGLMTHLNNQTTATLTSSNRALLDQLFETTHNATLNNILRQPIAGGNKAALKAFKELPRIEQQKRILMPQDLLENYSANGTSPKTVGDFLEVWKNRWVDAASAQHRGTQPTTSLKQLSTDLNTLFQRHILPVTEAAPLKRGSLPLTRFVRETAQNHQIQGYQTVVEQPLKATLNNLQRFTDFIGQTFRRQTKDASQSLLEHASQARHQLMHHKFLTTLAALAFSAGWLYLVPKLAQHHDDYPAIRQFRKEGSLSSVGRPTPRAALEQNNRFRSWVEGGQG